ncbi:carboxyl-terminal-processing peptidase 1, chloroplastic isoform X1 [Syzygium oleosum]|uniref:carboxyl-terminal-processing peptidase 1, chloroplastic isoform X1 n=1 Tax=Syzygium oleosum TaxID=219896 RepID=UPI0024BB4C1A|nr:carboxyl-terminal-processing peptidase 1, chloroplastic isoform X1 [Syzygium oleosum]XP_030475855.2 carboxyl-terminal-processing peptidase 1, chloroplastic isoform X1 [Syzygium oleosum]XP_056158574.1 carboxyl-terminal-processing peptidase 1, chloroplastic isoform X1 [Syzygium oleosum]XP_056158575.1 carboxyl-terminal-processing peptidase 1, chloroplastic isoform X1 [Syzygium oleosum]
MGPLLLLCNPSAALSPPPPPAQPLPPRAAAAAAAPPVLRASSARRKLLSAALSGALSLGLLLSPPSIAAESPLARTTKSLPSVEYCREEEAKEDDGAGAVPERGTNERIVEEAWDIVNESFLGTGRRRWSPEAWQRKKEDILSTSIPTRSKAHELIRRMLAGLGDPYTRFLSPDEFSRMARYDMTGIGINLREVQDDDGKVRLKVLGLLLDGPAHAAGVRQGDEILAVNGDDIRGKSAVEVSSLLQGPNGTSVKLEVKHGNCGPVQSFKVQRQLVARTPVFYRLEDAENGTSIGYIRLKEFNALAIKDIVAAMKRLQEMGSSYFILDLRDNLGGLVQAGIEIAKLFLNQGETVTYTVGRDSQYQTTITAGAAPLVKDPVIVLVNNKTASASEIVASALHDNCRAVLVGERTFGKGLIQSVFELDDGSGVVVTIGKYVTPNHMDINGNGIEPDYRSLPAWNEVNKHISKCKMLRQG